MFWEPFERHKKEIQEFIDGISKLLGKQITVNIFTETSTMQDMSESPE